LRSCAPFDQNHCNPQVIEALGGDPSQTALGNCTANAALGVLMTEPFHQPEWNYTEDDAVRLYHEETTLDNSQIPGVWPTDDTGSTGGWAMQALVNNGLIHDWHHTRSLHTALRLLMVGPVAIGVSWFNNMFTPAGDGTISVDENSGLAGGHEIELNSLDVDNQRVGGWNSWGSAWGNQGAFWLSWHDFDLLLHLGGDVVQPVI